MNILKSIAAGALATWRFLVSIAVWAWIMGRAYKAKSAFHRALFDGKYKDTEMPLYTSLHALKKWIAAQKWTMDSWDSLFDAICTVQKIQAVGQSGNHMIGDCFAKGTLVLRDDHQLVPVEALLEGDHIWGLDTWTMVTKTWDKPVLPTWSVRLNNGSSMRLTPDHKVWVLDCGAHANSAVFQPCSCPVAGRTSRRVTVRDLVPGQVLTQPTRLPDDLASVGPGRAHIEGLLRVVEVVKGGKELPCFDFETEDHYVWLPEADWTTSQCDEFALYTTYMIEKSLAAGYMKESNLQNPKLMSVIWVTKDWMPNGHNVCLLERPQPDGTVKYSYMDYGSPSEPPLDTPAQVADLIAAKYSGHDKAGAAKEAGVACWAIQSSDLTPVRGGIGKGWLNGYKPGDIKALPAV